MSSPLEIALRARIQDLEAALGLNNDNLGAVFRLPAAHAKLLGLLLAVQNVTPEMVQDRLGIVTDTKVAMHRLRSYLTTWAADNQQDAFEIKSRRTLGYWLDDSTKRRMREIVTSRVIPAIAPGPDKDLEDARINSEVPSQVTTPIS